MADRDKQNNPLKNIASLAQECSQKKYHLALTNPNFEFWLLLHLNYLCNYSEQRKDDFLNMSKSPIKSKNILETELAKLLGSYSKTNYQTDKILPFIDFAIKQAKSLEIPESERWHEDSLGTRIYKLLENIFNS